MAARGEAAAGSERQRGEGKPRRAALSPELIAILAMGVMIVGVMLAMMTFMMQSFDNDMRSVRQDLQAVREEIRDVRGEVRDVRGEVRGLRAGQIELRERVVRVESKLDVLAGDWPPTPARGTPPAG